MIRAGQFRIEVRVRVRVQGESWDIIRIIVTNSWYANDGKWLGRIEHHGREIPLRETNEMLQIVAELPSVHGLDAHLRMPFASGATVENFLGYSPGSLVLSIPALNDLMLARQYLLFEDFCSSTLVNPSNLENLSGIYVGVCTTAHHGDAADHAFVHLGQEDERVSVETRPRLTDSARQ